MGGEASKIEMTTNSDLSVESTPLEGCYVIHFPENYDERGSFYRKYCEDAFESSGLNSKWIQTNYSSNKRA